MIEYNIYYSKIEQNQPLAILGMIGSVACGKSTLTKVLTDVITQRHSKEKINNASINLGYTNLKIYFDGIKYICNPKKLNINYKLVKHLSISDAPGHNSYFASMISGSKFINICLFLISGINGIEPQTHQHMKVLKSLNIKDISMIITKCDQIKNNLAFIDIYDKIIDVLDEYFPYKEDSTFEPDIIPISNTDNINIDEIIDYIVNVPYPDLNININKKSSLVIIRSFDVNKPGTSIDNLIGATVGGTLTQGNFMINDLICILPGIKISEKCYKPLVTKIVSLKSDKESLDIAIPGAFIALSTTLDPFLSKDNGLVGQVVISLLSKEEIYDIKLTNNIYINEIIYYTDITELNINDMIIIMYYGNTIFGNVINKTSNDIIQISLRNHIYGNIGDEIMILKNNNGTLDFFAKAYISNINYDDVKLLIDDIELNKIIKTTNPNGYNRKINCINDICFSSNDYIKKDYENLTKKFIMNKKKYELNKNLELPNITKGTTKFTITNGKIILSIFFNKNNITTKNEKNLIKLMNKFGELISEKYNALSFNIYENSIIFNGIKNVKKKINNDGIMQCLVTLINNNFCCNNCHQFGTLYIDDNLKICKNCNANISFIGYT